jgi:hypothetical protein
MRNSEIVFTLSQLIYPMNPSWGSNISTFHQFRNLVNSVNIQIHLLLQPWTHESTDALQLFQMCFFSIDRKYKPLCLYLWYFNELVMACLFCKPKTCGYISDPPFGCREKLERETSRLEHFSMQWAFLIPTYKTAAFDGGGFWVMVIFVFSYAAYSAVFFLWTINCNHCCHCIAGFPCTSCESWLLCGNLHALVLHFQFWTSLANPCITIYTSHLTSCCQVRSPNLVAVQTLWRW